MNEKKVLEMVESSSRFNIDICTDQEEWNTFMKRNDGPAYNHWAWGEAVASYGHDQRYLVARDEDTDTIAAALPVCCVRSRLFGSKLLSPAFAERGSVILDSERETETAKQLLLERVKEMAANLDADFVSLRGAQQTDETEFTVKNRYVTFQVPVNQPADDVWSDMRDSRQRQINQAAELDSLRFETGSSIEDLKEYYQLYIETMHRHGSPPHSFEFFKILWDTLYDEGNFHLGLIFHEGKLINGMIDLSLGSTVYQWGVVNDYEYRDLNGGSLLIWKSLQRAAERGYDVYEFGRTREGSGVYMFKKSFGGTKVWYDDIHYFPDGEVDLPDPEDRKYERAREVWKRLPLSVTRTVGPHIRSQIGI